MARKTTCSRCVQELDGRHPSYCKACAAQYARENRAKNAEQYRAVRLEWWRNNKDKAKRYKKKSTLKSQYGLSVEEYEKRYEAHEGKCGICKQPPPDGTILHVDHNHTTNQVRGLLCMKCNFALGLLNEDLEIVARFDMYLSYYASKEQSTGGS